MKPNPKFKNDNAGLTGNKRPNLRKGPKERTSSEPIGINHVLANVLAKTGLSDDIERYKFVQHWPEIVGEAVAARTKPECIRAKALVVRVSNSAWAQELSFLKEDILAKLKTYLSKEELVEDVTFYVVGK